MKYVFLDYLRADKIEDDGTVIRYRFPCETRKLVFELEDTGDKASYWKRRVNRTYHGMHLPVDPAWVVEEQKAIKAHIDKMVSLGAVETTKPDRTPEKFENLPYDIPKWWVRNPNWP